MEDLLKLEKPVPEIKKDPPPPVISTKAAADLKIKPLLSTFKYTRTQLYLIAELVPGWKLARRNRDVNGFGYKTRPVSIYGELPKNNIYKPILRIFWDNYCEPPNSTGQSKFGLNPIVEDISISASVKNWNKGGKPINLNSTRDLINFEFPLPNTKIIAEKETVRDGSRKKIFFEKGAVFSFTLMDKV